MTHPHHSSPRPGSELQSHLQKMRRRLSSRPMPGPHPPQEPSAGIGQENNSEGGIFSPLTILDILRRRLWILLLLSGIFGGLVYQWSRSQPKRYKASCIVEIVADPPRLFNGIQDVISYRLSIWRFYDTQRVILTSLSIAQRALNSRSWILSDPGFYGLDQIKNPSKRNKIMAAMRPHAPHILKGKTAIFPIRKSSLFRIEIRETNPRRAQELALAMAESYQEHNRLFRLRTTLNAYKEIRRRLGDYRKESKKMYERLIQFRVKNNILTTTLDDRRNLALHKLRALNGRLIQVMLKRISLDAELQPLNNKKQAKAFREHFSPVLKSSLLNQLKSLYNETLLQQRELHNRYRNKHPKLREVNKKLKQINEISRRVVDNILTSHQAQRRAVISEERVLRYRVRKAKKHLQYIDQLNLEFEQILQRQKALNASLKILNKRYFELQLLKDSITTNVRIIEPPQLPRAPFAPRVRRSTFLSTFIVFFVLLGAFVLLELLDNTIRSMEDIEHKAKVPPIGEVPLLSRKRGSADKREPLYNPERPTSQLEEAVRAIRTNILFMANDGDLQKIVFSSPSPGEGKTFIITNLAIGFGHVGKRTLLIDTDMRRPRVHKILGLDYDRSKGISSAIIGQHDVREAILQTEFPNLSVLPCGPIPPSPTELFETEGFLHVLQTLEEEFDLLLFDSPPTLNVADSTVLSNYVDGVILVATSAKTKWNALFATARKIESVGGRLLGAVLNKFDQKHRRGYYYSRYYGYYRSDYRYTYSPHEKES